MPEKKAPLDLFADGSGAGQDPQAQNKNKTKDDLDREEDNGVALDIGAKERGSVSVSLTKMVLVKKLLENIKENNDKLLRLLSGFVEPEDEQLISIGQMSDENFSGAGEESDEKKIEGRIIEGVFDGENMIGPDGKQYTVPANYASKSKLVEGDILKLTITHRGTFVYKQIGPIERIRLIGRLEQEGNGNFIVVVDGRKLRVLTASVTYFKGQSGDEIVVLVPKNGESKWAAVENIVKDLN
ncbi:MAG: hypothetical protein MUC28_01685 [Planctomycetes bacterium]|jgi:hypothetical protein|nr:hypothetical protein [Planctomycetota bacterium]